MTLEDVLARLDGVQTRGSGRFVALCPVHQERTPSLSVRRMPDGGVALHCFGCGAGTRRILALWGAAGPAGPPPEPVPTRPLTALELACREALRRHPHHWTRADARLLLNAEILRSELRAVARHLHRAASTLPPDLDIAWEMTARAAALDREADYLDIALG